MPVKIALPELLRLSRSTPGENRLGRKKQTLQRLSFLSAEIAMAGKNIERRRQRGCSKGDWTAAGKVGVDSTFLTSPRDARMF
jgi:hypothetical protein